MTPGIPSSTFRNMELYSLPTCAGRLLMFHFSSAYPPWWPCRAQGNPLPTSPVLRSAP